MQHRVKGKSVPDVEVVRRNKRAAVWKVTGEADEMILRKLKQYEHTQTRPLWERVFEEDTSEFLDYYYTDKVEDNEIYVIEKDGEICSMLHLNPYLLKIGKKEEGSRYIVAVATDFGHRGQGYMTELLRKAVRDMYTVKLPFAFLMPADEKIYYPHNFRYIYAATEWEAAAADGEELSMKKLLQHVKGQKVLLRIASMADCKSISQFAERILEEKYQVYVKRDWLYYEMMLREQISQNGGILLAESEGEIKGVVLYDEENGFTVREPLTAPGYESAFEDGGLILTAKEKKKPIVMARVLHVESLLSCMTCTEDVEFSFILVDPVIRENNKLFIIKGNCEHLVVRTKPLMRKRQDDIQMISVDALTTLLFGYKSIEAIEEDEQETFSEAFKEKISKLVPLNKVFLNEIV